MSVPVYAIKLFLIAWPRILSMYLLINVQSGYRKSATKMVVKITIAIILIHMSKINNPLSAYTHYPSNMFVFLVVSTFLLS